MHAVALGKGLGAHRLSPSIVVLDEIAHLRKRLIRTDTFDESGRRVLPRPIDEALQVRARDRASRKHRERVLSRAPWLRRQPGAERALRTAQQNVFRVGADHMAMGSDYPHLLGSIEKAVSSIEGMDFSATEKDRIQSGTALAIMNNVTQTARR